MFVYTFEINCIVLYKSTSNFLIMLKFSALSSVELKVQEVLLNNVMCRYLTRFDYFMIMLHRRKAI